MNGGPLGFFGMRLKKTGFVFLLLSRPLSSRVFVPFDLCVRERKRERKRGKVVRW